MPGLRLPTPLPDAEAEVNRLEAAAVPEHTLDSLASLLSSIPPEAHPVLITAADEGALTLLFDDTMPVPDPPPAMDARRRWFPRAGRVAGLYRRPRP